MRNLKILLPIIASCLMTGCFQIQGVHVMHYWGESDSGGYRIKMNRVTYAMLNSDDQYSKMLKSLRSWSRPTTRSDDDSIYLEDTSGNASMEHFYDTSSCKPAPVSGFMDCHFGFTIPRDFAKIPNWSIDWEVVIQPNMRVLSSNHQRTRREGGLDHLLWYFDGNRVSEAEVDLTIRTPKAQ